MAEFRFFISFLLLSFCASAVLLEQVESLHENIAWFVEIRHCDDDDDDDGDVGSVCQTS
jgi:hypothetical protein